MHSRLAESRLERELARDLAPVRAPEALWMLVRASAPKRRPRRAAWPWAAAGSLAAAALALVFALSPPSLAQFAAAELAESGNPDLRSHDPQEISRWLREHAGVEISLPANTKVELLGASATKSRGAVFGGVLYRVAGHNAVLLASRTANIKPPARHGESIWAAHGQVYALAFDGPPGARLACQLCHVD
jgi:hypothetical protein